MIRSVKIAPYELRPAGQDLYEYLAGVAGGTLDPPSLAPKSLAFPGHIVMHSPLRRAVECIDPAGALRIEERGELKEIPFDMRSFCTREEWESEGSKKIRREFKKAFIDDTLPTRREILIGEVKKILEDAHAAEAGGPLVLLSHSFRLKVIEAYVKSEGQLAAEPTLINDYIHDEKKTYGFGEGFVIG